MYANLNSAFNDSLHENAKAVVGLNNRLSKYLGTAVSFFLIGIPSLPTAFKLRKSRRGLLKRMRATSAEFKYVDSYLGVRESFDVLSEFRDQLEKVSNIELNKVPFAYRFAALQMKKMASTLYTYSDWLTSRLAYLNEEEDRKEAQVFTLVTEQELWENRNKAYKYWM